MAKRDDLLTGARERGIDVGTNDSDKAIQDRIDRHDAATSGDLEAVAEGAPVGEGVASREENLALEHTEGGTTTRADLTDQGVAMLQGEATEPQGPEDAVGPGPKRGDYPARVVGDPHVVEATGAPLGAIVENEDGGIDTAPTSRLVSQKPRAAERGESPGLKGGVDTAGV